MRLQLVVELNLFSDKVNVLPLESYISQSTQEFRGLYSRYMVSPLYSPWQIMTYGARSTLP